MNPVRVLLAALCLAASATAASAQALSVVHTFPGPGPAGGTFIQAADGNFYGSANGGRFSAGVFFSGVIYRMTPAGDMTILYNFTGGADGAWPGTLMQASDGALYGTTYSGGTYGYGTIFKYTAAGLQTMHSFTRGSGAGYVSHLAPMVEAADGSLYGLSVLSYFQREIFRMTPGGTVTFPAGGLEPPDVALVKGADGGLYGTSCGGTSQNLFRINPDGTVTTVVAFHRCFNGLLAATDGNLYGTSGNSIIRLTLGGNETLLHAFSPSTEGGAVSALIQGADGNLYGTASGGGAHDSGTAFRLGLDGTFTLLRAFDPAIDGHAPGALIQAADGQFYGISTFGMGPFGENFFKKFLVFRLTAGGAVTPVRLIGYSDEGIKPSALVFASDGNFYGTSEFGGASNLGTVFRMTRAGAITVLYSFAGGTDGGAPEASLIQASDGSLYGITHGITSSGYFPLTYPTVFKVTLSGTVTTLHVFDAGLELSYPRAPLVQGTDGDFYGTTYFGLAPNRGSVFRMTSSGTTTVLHTFAGGADGSNPFGALVEAGGNFYGTTENGGASNLGTVFSMTPAGVVTVLHAFTGGADGSYPRAGLTPSGDGNFYGTTAGGGPSNKGTIFRITPAGTTTIVHAFGGGVDGESPEAPLVHATDGHFYGTTSSGGPLNKGTVFRMTASGAVNVVRSFSGGDGDRPYTALVDTADGNLFGTTSIGGFGYGNAFRLRVATTVAGTYDSDRKADLAVFRPSTGTWHILESANGYTTSIERSWGLPGDLPMPGDYDGDGRTDLAVYRTHPSASMWYILESGSGFTTSVSYAWGRSGDVPLPGDYDGDGRTDVAVYRPSTGVWLIRQSSTGALLSVALGRGNDVAVPADYDGDGKIDPAVYRTTTGVWAMRLSSTLYATASRVALGTPRFSPTLGDLPVPADYDGDGKADVAVYTQSTGTWSIVRSSVGGAPIAIQWGLSTDIPVPADYDGDGKADPAVSRGANGTWYVLESASNYTTDSARPWGLSGDLPLPGVTILMAVWPADSGAPISAVANGIRGGDLDGDGRTDPTVFRPATGQWFTLHSGAEYSSARVFDWGVNGDVPVPGDYDGDGVTDVAVYRPGNNVWYLLTSRSDFTANRIVPWGLSGDTPMPADYDGDGRTDIAVYRPSSGQWYIRWSSTDYATFSTYSWGLAGDVPLAGDYDGDGLADLVVYRPGNGMWYILQSGAGFTTAASYQWGLAGDVPVPGDYSNDGKSDLAVYRPSTGVWYVLQSNVNQPPGFPPVLTFSWGLPGDTPVAADYDGDGITDPAVFRPSTREWYVLKSTTNFSTGLVLVWGQAGDLPVTGPK